MIGGLMFVGGLGLVTIAEDQGVGSGLVAAGVAVMPLWAALWSGLFGLWPTRLEWLGLAVGFAGVAMLSQEGDFQASTLGTVLIVVAPVSWAFGSVVSSRIDMAKGNIGSAAQMLGGGVLLLASGLIRGEWIDEPPSLGAWLALAYLITAGSLIAYTAYLYLLANTRPAVATSYAYVNPVVAIVLGITLGDELIGAWAYVGLPIILAGVALVGLAQRQRVSS
jgi:drug/metabolite transporter (DMT)-like permease